MSENDYTVWKRESQRFVKVGTVTRAKGRSEVEKLYERTAAAFSGRAHLFLYDPWDRDAYIISSYMALFKTVPVGAWDHDELETCDCIIHIEYDDPDPDGDDEGHLVWTPRRVHWLSNHADIQAMEQTVFV